jgi:hypothetical protein
MQEHNSDGHLDAPVLIAIICDFIQTAMHCGFIFILTAHLIHSSNKISVYTSLILSVQYQIIFGLVLFINFKQSNTNLHRLLKSTGYYCEREKSVFFTLEGVHATKAINHV